MVTTAQVVVPPQVYAQTPQRETQPAVRRTVALRQLASEYTSALGDNSWLTAAGTSAAVARMPYPSLKGHGWHQWLYMGNYSNNGGTNTIDVQLMVDGVATGTVMTSSNITSFGSASNGTIRIEARLLILGNVTVAGEQQLELFIVVDDHLAAQKINDRKTQRYTISNTADHELALQIRKTTASPGGMTTNTLSIQSLNGLHFNQISGS